MKKNNHILSWFVLIGIVGLFLALHVYQLVILPVFADEAIYIRWSQLIIDDWKQYLFFPLNDGKTPLHMWLLVPFLKLGTDPLYMARLLSVLVGVGQMFAVGAIIRSLRGKQVTVWLGMMMTAVLPFWFFHHRMALIDALLTLWLSLTVWGLITLNQQHELRKQVPWVATAGVFFGLALLSKLPALLLLPAFPLFAFIDQTKPSRDANESTVSKHNVAKKSWSIGLAKLGLVGSTKMGLIGITRMGLIGTVALVGMVMFAMLKLHPAFGQLFSRGSDFLHPWKFVLLEGGWMQTIRNVPTYLSYASAYVTLPVMILVVAGLFAPDVRRRRQLHVLFWSAMAFAAPIALLGRVVYPRYFMPVVLFLTVGAALSVETLAISFVKSKVVGWKSVVVSLVLALLLANSFGQSAVFVYAALTSPAEIPFVSADKEQYLYEWSSGHGVTEVVNQIQQVAKNSTIAVATEGSFGTLPDAILMYLHNQNVDNIYVEGIGYPVKQLTPQFVQRAQAYDNIWLVVNSHRLEIDLPENMLLKEYCRPHGAPCLQIWDISDVVRQR